MATELTEKDFQECPILFEDESGKVRLIQADKMNLEIVFKQIIGDSGRGRKGIVRESWVSIPCYHSSLKTAFNKLLDLKATELLKDSRNDLERLETTLNRFTDRFLATVKQPTFRRD